MHGVLGVFEDLSEVELVSFASQDADATVIIPSQQESKIVGKISRRVCFVSFSKPEDLLEATKVKTQQKLVRAVTSSSLKNSNPAQSSSPRKSGQSALRPSASTRSSREKSPNSKREHSEPSSSKERGSGSPDRSGKSKKKVKTQK